MRPAAKIVFGLAWLVRLCRGADFDSTSLSGDSISHSDPIAPILIALVGTTLIAAIGGRLLHRLGQAAVLGELLTGVLVGNLGYV